MEYGAQVVALWNDMDRKKWQNLGRYFDDEAIINWHNTNESFSVAEFITVNSEYPGDWKIDIERLEERGNLVISVVKVQQQNREAISFHAVSFFEFKAGKIIVLDEYWGDDGKAPQWRIEKQIGRPITKK